MTEIPPFTRLIDRMDYDGFTTRCVDPVLFYSHKDWGSNFFPEPFELECTVALFMPWATDRSLDTRTIMVKSGEHAFQAAKASSRDAFIHILAAESCAQAKSRGRKTLLRPDWEDVKYDVMVEVVRSKFSPEHMRRKLMRTGKRPIYENSPTDDIWGVKRALPLGRYLFDGQNLLGKALMQVREEFRP
jgi:ribA/ribD-fused uncharacterized protein